MAQSAAYSGAASLLVGAAAGGTFAGISVGIARGAAALEAGGRYAGASALRGFGASLGFVVTGAICIAELSICLHKFRTGQFHKQKAFRVASGASIRAAVGCGVCGLAFIPVAGVPMAIVAGVAFALGDGLCDLSGKFAEWLVPMTEEERELESHKMYEKILQAARELVGVDQGLSEGDLKREWRAWNRELHPDKNAGKTHARYHEIAGAFAVLLTHARSQPLTRKESVELLAIQDNKQLAE